MPDADLMCATCLIGVCSHAGKGMHEQAAATVYKGTAFCAACAREGDGKLRNEHSGSWRA
jgi:hypothetical protein